MYDSGNEAPEFDHSKNEGRKHQQQKVNVRQNSKSVMKEPRPAVHEFSSVARLE
jgi:hypothetical protein